MIRFESVTKYFPTPVGRHFVLNDVSFEIPDGARVGVLGRNGAGKSTMMRLFSGVDAPNAGKITRTGTISWPMGLATSLHNSLTGRENARFACRIQGLASHELDEIVENIWQFAEIGKFFDMKLHTYSSGMRARLNFAIAMAFSFDCYIIDELTAVGDIDFRKKSAEVFQKKRASSSFIKVSHNLQELQKECDHGLLLIDGKAHLYPSIDEAISIYQEDMENRRKGGEKAPMKAAEVNAIARMNAEKRRARKKQALEKQEKRRAGVKTDTDDQKQAVKTAKKTAKKEKSKQEETP